VNIPNIESVKLLLDAGANPNPMPDIAGQTPLSIARIRESLKEQTSPADIRDFKLIQKMLLDASDGEPSAKRIKK
jgi:ankyrin repeat protein